MSAVFVDVKRPHGVYRIRDVLGRLLYVGCSVNPEKRLRQHRTYWATAWGQDEVTMTVEWHPTLALGREAERVAIEEERPIWNTVHQPDVEWPRPQKPPHPEWALVWAGETKPPWQRLRPKGPVEF